MSVVFREPKTNRPVQLAIVGSAYSVWAISRDGNTLMPSAFDRVRELVHSEGNFLMLAVLVLLCEVAAVTLTPGSRVRELARIVLLSAALAAWAIFGVEVFAVNPRAILPGYALVMVGCNSLALFDALRPRWHR